MHQLLLLCRISVLTLAISACGIDVRVWTDITRRHTLEAEFVKLEGDNVTLRKADGTEKILALNQLCEADREFAISQSKLMVPEDELRQKVARLPAAIAAKPGDFKLTWNFVPPYNPTHPNQFDQPKNASAVVVLESKWQILKSDLKIDDCRDSDGEPMIMKPIKESKGTTGTVFEKNPGKDVQFITFKGMLTVTYASSTKELNSNHIRFEEGSNCTAGKYRLRIRIAAHDSPKGTFINLVSADALDDVTKIEFFNSSKKIVPSVRWFGSTFGAVRPPRDDGIPINFIQSFQLEKTTRSGGIRLSIASQIQTIEIPLDVRLAVNSGLKQPGKHGLGMN